MLGRTGVPHSKAGVDPSYSSLFFWGHKIWTHGQLRSNTLFASVRQAAPAEGQTPALLRDRHAQEGLVLSKVTSRQRRTPLGGREHQALDSQVHSPKDHEKGPLPVTETSWSSLS